MPFNVPRYAAAIFGFAVATIWTTVGSSAALTCLLASGLCAAAVAIVQRGVFPRLVEKVKRENARVRELESGFTFNFVRTRVPRSPGRRRRAMPMPKPKPAARRTRPPAVPAFDVEHISSEELAPTAGYGW